MRTLHQIHRIVDGKHEMLAQTDTECAKEFDTWCQAYRRRFPNDVLEIHHETSPHFVLAVETTRPKRPQ